MKRPKKQCHFRLSSVSELQAASKRGGSYNLNEPPRDRIMWNGWNVRAAIAALKPGEGIHVRHRSFIDVVYFAPGKLQNNRDNRTDNYSGPPLQIVKRFVKIAQHRG